MGIICYPIVSFLSMSIFRSGFAYRKTNRGHKVASLGGNGENQSIVSSPWGFKTYKVSEYKVEIPFSKSF